MADRYKTINIYDQYPNSGELELGANLLNPTATANVTNRTDLGNSYFDTMVGTSYQPTDEDNKINNRLGFGFGNGNLNINALMDEYKKSAGAEYGPAYANITQTDNDLIKQLGYEGQNFGANITNSNQGTEFGINALLNMFGGKASVGAYKNPEDQGLQFLFNKSF
jgi:hypothetical protein